MSLTPSQEIFILLEDEKEVPLYRLNRWGRQARGVLAKLKNQGCILKEKKDDDIYYKITDKGEKSIDKLLKPLKQTGKWDGRWRLVMFNIPEAKRNLRDRIRRSLVKLGMGILQPSVWISPNDIKDEIEETKKKLNLENTLKYFEVTRNTSLDRTILEKSWNLPELEDEYRQFNFKSERILRNIDNDRPSRYTAKKLIFEYALILQKDPIIPWEFRNKDEVRRKAQELYLKLREYVT